MATSDGVVRKLRCLVFGEMSVRIWFILSTVQNPSTEFSTQCCCVYYIIHVIPVDHE